MENGELSEVAEPFSAVRSTYYSVRHKRGEKDKWIAGRQGVREMRRKEEEEEEIERELPGV